MALRRITREQQEREAAESHIDALQQISFYGGEIARLHATLARWLRSTDDPAVVRRLLRILKESDARLAQGHKNTPVVFEAD